MFKYVAGNTTYNNMNLGNIISVRLYYPTGYRLHALYSVTTDDWSVAFHGCDIKETYVDIQCVKLVSGAANVTAYATIVCTPKYLNQ